MNLTFKQLQPYRVWYEYLCVCLEHKELSKKIDRQFYKSWDLSQLKSGKFDKWFKTHSHLFVEKKREITLFKGKRTPNTLLVEIPTNLKVEEIMRDIGKIVKGNVAKKQNKSEARSVNATVGVREGKEDEAELVMASKDMVDRVTSWMEDTAEMQTESMLELADAIRDEMGIQQSDAFVQTVKPALETMYAAMETTRAALTQGVGMLTGEGERPPEDMGGEPT